MRMRTVQDERTKKCANKQIVDTAMCVGEVSPVRSYPFITELKTLTCQLIQCCVTWPGGSLHLSLKRETERPKNVDIYKLLQC